MENPRFPHTLVVKRPRLTEDGDIFFDANGFPVYDVLVLDKVKYMDNEPLRNADGTFVTEQVQSMPFGYRNSNETRESGDVVVTVVKIACPVFTTPLKYDDQIYITDYDREYIARLVKKTTFNWGTNLWIDEVKN